MTRQPRPHLVRLYPEVGQAGSLQNVMQAAFDGDGYELTALLTEAPGWWDCATVVNDGNRHVSTVLGSEERWFLMEFWERGVMVANGKTTDLAAPAGATATWQLGSSLAALREVWPFVRYGELAEAFERGNPTQVKWEILRRSEGPIDRSLIEAAYARSALRMLFPFSSHRSLNLSRCTRHPYSNELPVIYPLPGHRFTVFWRPRSPYGTGHIADADTAADAVAILIAH
ncbi:MAG: DUF6193 family natural product biosynthesis protein [Actinomadura sp.]